MFNFFLNWLEKIGRRRTILDRREESVYLERYYILFPANAAKRRWFPFNILLHHLCRSDEDEMHDHPWAWASLILKGGYWEHTPKGKFWRGVGSFRLNSAKALHRLEVDKEKAKGEVWSLFFVGVRVRDWGFINADGRWVQWQEYLGLKQDA